VTIRGDKLGVQTPINAAIQAEVHTVAQRKARPSLELARALYDRTRAIVNGPYAMPPPSGECEPDPAALDPEVPEEPRGTGPGETRASL
jgi:hypothetical protein